MSLQSKLDAFKADFEAGKPPYSVPPSVIETMHRATAELIASGAATRALKAGDQAPPFTLNDPDGKPVSSAALLARGPLVVSFYRGVWCPSIWSCRRFRPPCRRSRRWAQASSPSLRSCR
ncbi:redoxin family protein [Nitrospirillum viridazoti]|uniref:redoxin family protein n=1 Tax=Nitrospirillum viridazoti TaxID=3144925 RepID=UPI0023EA53EF|nr:redoxin family protein [Nitrospirillum amazonense]